MELTADESAVDMIARCARHGEWARWSEPVPVEPAVVGSSEHLAPSDRGIEGAVPLPEVPALADVCGD